MAGEHSLISIEPMERSILTLRGHRVMLESALAALYGVDVKVLLERAGQVRGQPLRDVESGLRLVLGL